MIVKTSYHCEFCNRNLPEEEVISHEEGCDYNPNNMTCLTCCYFMKGIIFRNNGVYNSCGKPKFVMYWAEPNGYGIALEVKNIFRNNEPGCPGWEIK